MLVGLVAPAQFITQTFWVQDHFPDRQVLYVALMAGSRGVAMLTFSLIGGAIADRFERRRVLLACESLSLFLNACVALLMLTTPFGEATIIGITVLTFFAAGNTAIDLPARTASIPAITGMEDLGNAISLTQIANQVAIPLTIPLASVLNGVFDPGIVYASTLVAWAGILPLIGLLRYRSRGGARQGTMFGTIRDGLRYALHDRVIFPVIGVFVIMNVIGMVGTANLGVVWVRSVLHASPAGFAAMAFCWGSGAILGSMFFAQRHDLAARGRTLCITTLAFSVGSIVYGYSRSLPLTGVVNVGLGFAIAGTVVSAATIVQRTVAEEMRGRVMGLFPLTNGLAMVNTAPVGAIGQAVGLAVVMPILGWITLALVAAMIVARPHLRAIRPGLPGTALPVPSSAGGS